MIRLLTFASVNYEQSLKRFRNQAEKSNLFDQILTYTENDLPHEFMVEFGDALRENKRGFGYWIWKPYLVFKELSKCEPDDILIYLDAGFVIRKNEKWFRYYLSKLLESPNDTLGFVKPFNHELNGKKNYYLESNWTKGDVIDYFGVRNNEAIIASPQVISGILFLQKSEKSTKLMQEWWTISSQNFRLLTDEDSFSPNFSGFIENRHDQSILSMLFKINNVKTLPTSEVEGDTAFFGMRPFLALRSVGGRFKYNNLWVYGLNRLIKNPKNLMILIKGLIS
jgi:hypothetical protein